MLFKKTKFISWACVPFFEHLLNFCCQVDAYYIHWLIDKCLLGIYYPSTWNCGMHCAYLAVVWHKSIMFVFLYLPILLVNWTLCQLFDTTTRMVLFLVFFFYFFRVAYMWKLPIHHLVNNCRLYHSDSSYCAIQIFCLTKIFYLWTQYMNRWLNL